MGSAHFQRAGDGILPSRTSIHAKWRRLLEAKIKRLKSSLRQNAATSTPEACAPPDVFDRSPRRLLYKSALRFCEIGLVDFEPDKFFHPAALRRDGRVSDTEKRVEHRFDASRACGTMQFDTPFR